MLQSRDYRQRSKTECVIARLLVASNCPPYSLVDGKWVLKSRVPAVQDMSSVTIQDLLKNRIRRDLKEHDEFRLWVLDFPSLV